MIDTLDKLHEEVTGRLERCASEEEIEQVRIDYLGRKGGKLTALMRGLRELPADERPRAGQELNRRRAEIEELLEARLEDLRANRARLMDQGPRLDVTLPGNRVERGRVHPLTQVTDEIIDVFTGMGFEIARGPDVEDDYHNFEALNIPRDHPARDMQDT
ncbi:MAG: phenylalanine--tRNA ligase subunit alpha, partial [Deltaproteobacteria bacterium]|nr:phenylalanine--tRNA ligase subunit alpha [Deltaproteobacteria bacterium]